MMRRALSQGLGRSTGIPVVDDADIAPAPSGTVAFGVGCPKERR